ncbi:MAG: hypothetical protein M3505_00230 [Verrucomicrobiota bacterium]|nr:hypothetical protein [Verrucomicrobiota bacterium]
MIAVLEPLCHPSLLMSDYVVINIEDPIGKTVGRRKPRDPLSLKGQTKADKRAWRRAFPTPFTPKGVYRFHSHEEADAWLLKMITRVPLSQAKS